MNVLMRLFRRREPPPYDPRADPYMRDVIAPAREKLERRKRWLEEQEERHGNEPLYIFDHGHLNEDGGRRT